MVIKKGILGQNIEVDWFVEIDTNKYELDNKLKISVDSNCYYRCEVELNSNDNIKRLALSNPIWFKIIS